MKKLLTIAAMAALMTACSNTDVFDSTAIENNLKAEYTANFKKAYPNINLNQSWDFSNKNPQFYLPSSTAAARTRAANDYSFKAGADYEVEDATLTWLSNKLVEKRNNKSLGSPFYMSVPNNSFTIVPIFQGKAELIWDLHLVVDGVDIKVWEKSQNMWVKTKADQEDWTPVFDVATKQLDKNTINAKAVKATPYTFENLPVGADMYFYLDVVGYDTGTNHAKSKGLKQSSLKGMMLALNDCPVPSNLTEAGNEVLIIGCEDLDGIAESTDWDLNDVVFMVYGKPDVPQPKKIKTGDPVVQKKTVRYMIEDLGATDDFDFNDIVLDVSEYQTQTPIYTNGVLTSWEDVEGTYHQEAIIRHLGGELPFKLTIGDTELEEHRGVMGSNPDEKFEVTGWDIERHNITVQVQQKDNQGVYNNVVFPKVGEAPMIIAVEPSQEWMKERVSIPADWFTVPESNE